MRWSEAQVWNPGRAAEPDCSWQPRELASKRRGLPSTRDNVPTPRAPRAGKTRQASLWEMQVNLWLKPREGRAAKGDWHAAGPKKATASGAGARTSPVHLVDGRPGYSRSLRTRKSSTLGNSVKPPRTSCREAEIGWKRRPARNRSDRAARGRRYPSRKGADYP